jgi:hypothetical protein
MGPVCPAGERSAAATHLVATGATSRPALLLTVPRTAPTTSTADASVSAEVMQPPIETAYGSGQLIGDSDATVEAGPKVTSSVSAKLREPLC